MSHAKQAKEWLLEALGTAVDPTLLPLGFERSPRSACFVRKGAEAEHRLDFVFDSKPGHSPQADAHLRPMLEVRMPRVSEMALALAGGDPDLLAGAPQLLLREAIDATAPKDKFQRWLPSGAPGFESACRSITAFATQWVTPFFDALSTPAGIIAAYETNDARIVKQQQWPLYVAAAYRVQGDDARALDVLSREFRAPALRKRFASAFTALGAEVAG
jgi:hypothetical protein